MSYHDLLTRYGTEQTSATRTENVHVLAPRVIKTPSECAYIEGTISAQIHRLQSLIADLSDYRQALAARYAELVTLPYTFTLSLERVPSWRGNIEYIVTIQKVLTDGTTTEELREVYPGKERAKAFKRFEQLRKQRPGIETRKDIERRAWEK